MLKSFLNPDRFVFLFCLFSRMKPQSDRKPRGITSIHHCSDASDMAADTVRSWHRTLYATYSTIGRIHLYAVCYDTVTDLLTSEVFLANHKGKVSVPGCCAFHTVNDAEKICQAWMTCFCTFGWKRSLLLQLKYSCIVKCTIVARRGAFVIYANKKQDLRE
jgi:hypothetical protein